MQPTQQIFQLCGYNVLLTYNADHLTAKVTSDLLKKSSSANAKIDIHVSLTHSTKPFAPPPLKSLMNHRGPLGIQYRTNNGIVSILKDKLRTECNFDNFRLDVLYSVADPRFARSILSSIKWLATVRGEKEGMAYIHASAVNYNGKYVVFAGHSGSGKTSCMARLIYEGAELVTDDVVLINKAGVLPFQFAINPKRDFWNRFPGFDRDKIRYASEPKQASLVCLPTCWTKHETELQEISSEHGLAELEKFYLTEARVNGFPIKKDDLRARYEKALSNSQFYRLFLGTDQAKLKAVFSQYPFVESKAA